MSCFTNGCHLEKVLQIADKELYRHRVFQSNCRIRKITSLRHIKSLIPERKGKTVLAQVMKAHGGVGGMAPLSRNLGSGWRWSTKKFVILKCSYNFLLNFGPAFQVLYNLPCPLPFHINYSCKLVRIIKHKQYVLLSLLTAYFIRHAVSEGPLLKTPRI